MRGGGGGVRINVVSGFRVFHMLDITGQLCFCFLLAGKGTTILAFAASEIPLFVNIIKAAGSKRNRPKFAAAVSTHGIQT